MSEPVTPANPSLQAIYAALRLGSEPVHSAFPSLPPAKAGTVVSGNTSKLTDTTVTPAVHIYVTV